MKLLAAKLELSRGGLTAMLVRLSIVVQLQARRLKRQSRRSREPVTVPPDAIPSPTGWVDVAEGRMLAARCKDSQRIDFKHLVGLGPISPSVDFRIRMVSARSTRPQIHRRPTAEP